MRSGRVLPLGAFDAPSGDLLQAVRGSGRVCQTAREGAGAMIDTPDLTEALALVGARCARCDGPLPAPINRLAIIHGCGGEILTTCSTASQAGLVADLTGHTGEPAAGGRN